jgi:hypothetical protein
MHYCGLDVSRKSTHVCIEDGQGRRVTRGVVPTTPTGLAGAVERYAERGRRVAIAHCHLGLGNLYRRTSDRVKAQEHLTTAATMYREMGMNFWLAKSEAALSEVHE